MNYSRTPLQRTPIGPGLTVRPTGVCSFAGVLVSGPLGVGRRGGGGSLVLNQMYRYPNAVGLN